MSHTRRRLPANQPVYLAFISRSRNRSRMQRNPNDEHVILMQSCTTHPRAGRVIPEALIVQPERPPIAETVPRSFAAYCRAWHAIYGEHFTF